MSEQVSPSTGGGLLSLNLSITPQGSQSATPGAVPLLGGFGAVLNQQADSSVPVAEFASGGMLPSEGEALPQKLQQLLPEEPMQDQLRQLAQLLEQQSAQDSQLPPELSTELARALRQYTEQQPIMPVKGERPKEVEEVPAEIGSDNPVSVPDNPGVAVVSDAAERVGVNPLPSAVPSDSVANTSIGSAVLEGDSEETSANVASNASVDPDGWKKQVSPDVAAQVVRQDQAQAQASKATEVMTEDKSGARDVGAVLSGSAVQNQQPSQQGARQSAIASHAMTDVPNHQQTAGTNQSVKSEVPIGNVQAEIKSAQVKTENAVASASVGELRSVDSGIRRVEAEAAKPSSRIVSDVAASTSEGVKSDLVLKPQADNSNLRKIESALEMTQQLMQKVSASDKGDVTATQVVERLASNTIGQVNSASPTAAQKAVTEGQNLMMPQNVKVNTPAWNNALGERAIMIAAQNTRVAEIRLDPPELGSLNIRVNINQDQVSLNFTSPHAHVRDAVEQSLPRLREMFAEQGLALQDSSVSDQSADQHRREQFADDDSTTGQYGGLAGADAEEANVSENARSVSLVDYYA